MGFSWDMKCDWTYCSACGQCDSTDMHHVSLVSNVEARHTVAQSQEGPFDILGWFRHDENDISKAEANEALKKVDERVDASLEDVDSPKADDGALRSALKAKKRSSDKADEEDQHADAKDGNSKKKSSDKAELEVQHGDAKDGNSKKGNSTQRHQEQNQKDQHADAEEDSSNKESKSSETHEDQNTKRCDDWCSKEMFVKVEANSTVMKNLSSWAMKCSWAYCGSCSACSDPSLKLEEPPRKKHDGKQQLSAEEHTCEDWCSSEEFEVVHHNATATNKFSWDMKCDWTYCSACGQCQVA